MYIFYEKSNETILRECRNFIKDNKESVADYYVYREALSLYIKLSQALIESHKGFDEAIREETDKLIFLDDGLEKDCRIFQFNQANYRLVLDAESHQILAQLSQIEINNRTKR